MAGVVGEPPKVCRTNFRMDDQERASVEMARMVRMARLLSLLLL